MLEMIMEIHFQPAVVHVYMVDEEPPGVKLNQPEAQPIEEEPLVPVLV
jgi:hypothetical protein